MRSRTDGHPAGQIENIMPPAPVGGGSIKRYIDIEITALIRCHNVDGDTGPPLRR